VFDKSVDTFVREVLQNARDQKLASEEIVRVRFRIEDLEGPDLEAFLQGVRWSELRPHLDSIAAADYVTISPRVADALAQLQSGRLRLLRIDDEGTHGLTGGEDEVDSNFNALCRHTLITGSARRESGGSFGLGKSVLWRFSGVSTVLFASKPADVEGRDRFFGRTLLAWHATDENEWEGSGWLGQPETRLGGRRAVSVWDDEAAALSAETRLTRDSTDSGTSILVLAFDDPARETERDLPELCSEIADSAAKWFWPAIEAGRMRVRVEGADQTGEVFAREVKPTPEVMPFLEAQTAPIAGLDRVSEPGQVAERKVRVAIPARRALPGASAKPPTEGTAEVRLRLAESGEDSLVNRVALQRGTGMVVDYWMPPRLTSDQAFHAVLVAGTGHGSDRSDHALEEFLRAAEPVAHTEWTWTTDRVRAEYAAGATASLRSLHDQIAASIREMLKEAPADTSEGPEALRRFFPLPARGGGTVATEPYRLSGAAAYLSGQGWIFGGVFSRTGRTDSRWRIRIALQLEQEAGGRGDALPILSLSSDSGAVSDATAPGVWEILVDSGISRVRFDGRTESIAGIPPSALSRTKVRLDVRTVVETDA
jgi:hypothetical protein